MFVKYMGVWDR